MNRLPATLLALLSLTVLFQTEMVAADTASADAKQIHSVRGVVRNIAADRRKAVIRHEAIPNYMAAMTMELTVRNPKELEGIKAGDTVTFRLLANDETHWIDTIRRVAGTNGPAVAPVRTMAKSVAELKPGDLLPDAELMSESGRRIHFSDFRGCAVAFTFIFTRCPLPDFCPLMGRNFSKARGLLLAGGNAPTNWQFLSISFDADFDQPDVLARYAKNYRGQNNDRWLFAAASTNALIQLAPRLDLMVTREGGSFSHNLRTVVLDTRGRIHRQFDGNEWKAQDLAGAIREASAVPVLP